MSLKSNFFGPSSQTNIPCTILNWISSFLTGRTQQVKHASHVSAPKPINLGIVQGSGVGPRLYTVMESDLKTLSDSNTIFKYADDTCLFQKKRILSSLLNLKTYLSGQLIPIWLLMLAKPKKLFSTGLQPFPYCLLFNWNWSCLLSCLVWLSVTINDHVKNILTTSICSQQCYSLKCLRSRPPAKELNTIFYALIVSWILHALPAWGGFLTVTADLTANWCTSTQSSPLGIELWA